MLQYFLFVLTEPDVTHRELLFQAAFGRDYEALV